MRLLLAALLLCASCDELRDLTSAEPHGSAAKTAGVDVGPWMLAPGATTMTVAWVSDQATAATIQYGTAELDQSVTEKAPATEHRVVLENLKPATAYKFHIDGDPEGDGTFTTAPEQTSDAPFEMVVYGDNRTNGGDHALIARAVGAEPAVVALHTGDMVVNAKDNKAWRHWFAEERDLLAHIPIIATVGNHEITDKGVAYSKWFKDNGRPTYHSLDYGPVHVAVLDSFELVAGASPHQGAISDAQRQWLEADLKSVPQSSHVFVLVHQGPYAHPAKIRGEGHGGSELVKTALRAAARIHPIEAVFAGHEHFYERGEIDGLHYFVVGGGGAPLEDPDPTFPGVLKAKKSLSYILLDVKGCKVAGKVKDIAGNVIDSFSLGNCPPSPVAEAPK